MKSGIYPEMSEKDYRQLPAQNYSALADFNISQDHALLEKSGKSYFEEGNAFELLVEDRAKGTSKFAERFFLADAPGNMPDDLAGWIENKEDLNTKYRLKNDGSRNNQSKRLHAWLDECQDNPGMMPMGTDQVEMLGKMVDNFMLMPVMDDMEETLEEALPAAQFQIPIVWNTNGIQKKALIDILIETESTIYVWDVKTAATIANFKKMFRKRYFIQEIHYSSGLGSIFPGKNIVWRFLVSSKTEPWLAQSFYIDEPYVDKAWEYYSELCESYQLWLDAGRPSKGYKESKGLRLYFD